MATELDLFQLALGLPQPWQVERVEFSGEPAELHLHVVYVAAAGGAMPCPQCGARGPLHDRSEERTWRHLNFFQYKAFLHARLPRVRCAQCGVKTVSAPWARPGSGFTLLFEAFVLLLAKQMPVAALAGILGEHDTRLWRVLEHYVEQAREAVDMSQVEQIGIDETSRRGHEYVTVVADQTSPQATRVLFVTEGKDAATVERFKGDLEAHGGQAGQIRAASLDLSPAFASGVAKEFPQALLVFDRVHVMKLLNEAVDQVRRQEVKSNALLKETRYLWLKNPENLSERQQDKLASLLAASPLSKGSEGSEGSEGSALNLRTMDMSALNLATATAYQMKLNFQELWSLTDREAAAAFLERWYRWVMGNDSPCAMQKVAQTIRTHAAGILNYFEAPLTNGLLEGINSLIQAAKSKARGYRSTRYLKTIIYLVAGKLDFRLPAFHSR